MGTHRILGGSGVVWTLLLGCLGCVDRVRPGPFAGPGNGAGPESQVLTPGELDTVHLGKTFALDVRVIDPDGVDSVWTTLEPNVNTLPRIAGSGADTQTVGYSVFLGAAVASPGDTLLVHVQGTDLLGDTGAVFTRRLLIQ